MMAISGFLLIIASCLFDNIIKEYIKEKTIKEHIDNQP